MRVVVDNSGYLLRNLGDVAMLQVAGERLRRLFPGAELCILTYAPELLGRYVGGRPLDPRTGCDWGELRLLPIKYAWLPERDRARLDRLERTLRRRAPVGSTRLGLMWRRIVGEKTRITLEGVRAITGADLVIASGGGYLTDEFPSHALGVLDTLELAQTAGRPTALVGQGIGPAKDPALLARMREVLPGAQLIALREGKAGLPLLRSLGVAEDKIVVTGDDAIELAYRARPAELGSDLGINLRLARYSSIGHDDACRLASILHAAACQHRTALRPIPIDWRDEPDSDLGSLRLLLDGQGNDAPWPEDDTPLALIRQVGHCRLVVTGSYHAGVFALAQGIPVVGVVRSQYYVDKLLGLTDQFGCGCEVLALDAPDFEQQLARAIDEAWQAAHDLRPTLLDAAQRQIALGHDAYRRLASIVAHGKPPRGRFGHARPGRRESTTTSGS